MVSLKNIICRIKANLIYKYTFLRFGSKSILRRPLEIRDKKSISIGNGVYIAEQIWLLATKTGKRCEKIFIGNGVQIGHYAHIVANERVCIENDVLIADKVFISDCPLLKSIYFAPFSFVFYSTIQLQGILSYHMNEI